MLREQAFSIIENKLFEELEKQNFASSMTYKDDLGKGIVFKSENSAYGVTFADKKSSFILRSAALDEDGLPGDWTQLSMWLFDEDGATKGDMESIANDFLEVVQGPKRIATIKNTTKKRKKKGDDENNIDPVFFFNRLVGVFPELKSDMNQEKITYGEIRVATFTRNVVAPKIENLGKQRPNSEEFKKVKTLIVDMYKEGDGDLRGIISHGIFCGINDEAVLKNLSEDYDEQFMKIYKCAVKLKGKKIKPEKEKLSSKVVAASLENGANGSRR